MSEDIKNAIQDLGQTFNEFKKVNDERLEQIEKGESSAYNEEKLAKLEAKLDSFEEVNQEYLKQNNLKVELLGRGFAWLDTGTHDSLMEAGQFIETIEKRQGLKVACLEEIAYYMSYIDKNQLKKLSRKNKN